MRTRQVIGTWARAWRGSPGWKREADISVFTRLIFAAYFLEAGLILIVAPWSGFWDRNYFAQDSTLWPLLDSPYVRGAVSGLGFVTALAGLAELGGALGFRSKDRGGAPPTAS